MEILLNPLTIIYIISLQNFLRKNFGDNILHVDRFLPNLKLIYFPFSVNKDSAPFKYALGSHKINDEYLNFFKK